MSTAMAIAFVVCALASFAAGRWYEHRVLNRKWLRVPLQARRNLIADSRGWERWEP